MTVIEALIDLQEVDGRIRELEKELKDLPARRAQETARLSGVSADLQSAKAGLEYANQRLRSFEEEEKGVKGKIQEYKTTQAGLKSNKEYQQYSTQIDLLNHDLDTIISNQVAAADELPAAQAKIDRAQARFDAEKGGVDAFCAEIDERIASVKVELEQAKAERAEKAKAVANPQFMLYYERLKTKRWPVVAVLTHDGVCDGCHLVQPPSVSQMVDANAKNAALGKEERIVACTMCGRILYRD